MYSVHFSELKTCRALDMDLPIQIRPAANANLTSTNHHSDKLTLTRFADSIALMLGLELVVALQLDTEFLGKRGHGSSRGGCATPLLDRPLRKHGSRCSASTPPSSPTQSASAHGSSKLQIPQATLKLVLRTSAGASAAAAATRIALWSEHANTAPLNGPASTAMNPLRPPKAHRWWAVQRAWQA